MAIATAPEIAIPTGGIRRQFDPSDLWWEALDTVVDREALANPTDLTPKELAQAAGHDWEVKAFKTFAHTGIRGPRGAYSALSQIEIPNMQSLLRTDTYQPLSVMGGRYTIAQNEKLWELAKKILGVDAKLSLVGAGEFGGGKIVWAQFILPESFQIKGDPSATKPYLLLFNSHDGSKGFGAVLTLVRVVCRNTFNAAIAGALSKFIIRHTPGLPFKFEQAAEALGIARKYVEVYHQTAEKLAGIDMGYGDFLKFTEEFLPIKGDPDKAWKTQRDRETLGHLFELENPLLIDVPETRYRALQAVTQWVDHERTYIESKANDAANNRALSLFDGQGVKLKASALGLLLN